MLERTDVITNEVVEPVTFDRATPTVPYFCSLACEEMTALTPGTSEHMDYTRPGRCSVH
jgi:hypothetical protein